MAGDCRPNVSSAGFSSLKPKSSWREAALLSSLLPCLSTCIKSVVAFLRGVSGKYIWHKHSAFQRSRVSSGCSVCFLFGFAF